MGDDCRIYRALSVWLVEQYVKRSLLILKNFAIFWLCRPLMTKDTKLSRLFHTACDGKLGRAWERGWKCNFRVGCYPCHLPSTHSLSCSKNLVTKQHPTTIGAELTNGLLHALSTKLLYCANSRFITNLSNHLAMHSLWQECRPYPKGEV